MSNRIMMQSSGTGRTVYYDTGSSTNRTVITTANNTPIIERADNLEHAVYAHIQAIRALGRTTINTNEIARALGVSASAVREVAAKLREKGVKEAGRANKGANKKGR